MTDDTREALEPFVWRAIETRVYEACDGSIWVTAEEAMAQSQKARSALAAPPQAQEPVAMLGGINGVALIQHIEQLLPNAREQYHTPLYASPPAVPAGAVTREQLKNLRKEMAEMFEGGNSYEGGYAISCGVLAGYIKKIDAILALLSRAPSDRATKSDGGVRRAPDICTNCFDESDCASIGVCRAVHGGPSDTNAPSDDWRDIAIAPKDGTHFIGWDGKRAFRCFNSRHYVKWPHDPGGPTFRDVWSGDYYDSVMPEKPTHWQPLPTPPTKGGTDGK